MIFEHLSHSLLFVKKYTIKDGIKMNGVVSMEVAWIMSPDQTVQSNVVRIRSKRYTLEFPVENI